MYPSVFQMKSNSCPSIVGVKKQLFFEKKRELNSQNLKSNTKQLKLSSKFKVMYKQLYYYYQLLFYNTKLNDIIIILMIYIMIRTQDFNIC